MSVLVLLGLLATSQGEPKFAVDDRAYVGVNFSADGRFLAACGDLFKVGDFKPVRELKLRGLVDEHARHAADCPVKELNLHKLEVLAGFLK